MNQKELRTLLTHGLSVSIDDLLEHRGFRRRKDSLNYVRARDAAVQAIEFQFDWRPGYQPGADARLMPRVTIVMEDLNKVAMEMVAGKKELIGNAEVTIAQPFDIAIPQEHHVRWFIVGAETVMPCLQSVAECLETWIIPFLDDYTTPEAVAGGYERRDDRILHVRHFYVYVAGAFLLCNEPAKAMQVLERHFGKAAVRRRYSQAFNYVSARLR